MDIKDKIASELRTAYANMGLGDKALDGVASFLGKTVEDENKVGEAVRDPSVLALLKGIQGETDSLRGRAADLQRRLDAQRPREDGGGGSQKSEPDGRIDELVGKVEELERTLRERDERARLDARLSAIRGRLEDGGADNANILGLVMRDAQVGAEEADEAAVSRLKGEYDVLFKKFYGSGPVPPAGGNAPAAPKGMDAELVAQLRRDGKLPPEGNS